MRRADRMEEDLQTEQLTNANINVQQGIRAHRIAVPVFVKLRKIRAVSIVSWREGDFRKSAFGNDCLKDFVKLEGATDEDVKGFVERWGILDFGKSAADFEDIWTPDEYAEWGLRHLGRGRPDNSEFDERMRLAALDALLRDAALMPETGVSMPWKWSYENVEFYRIMAEQAAGMLEIIDALRQRKQPANESWNKVLWRGSVADKWIDADLAGKTPIADFWNQYIASSTVGSGVSRDQMKMALTTCLYDELNNRLWGKAKKPFEWPAAIGPNPPLDLQRRFLCELVAEWVNISPVRIEVIWPDRDSPSIRIGGSGLLMDDSSDHYADGYGKFVNAMLYDHHVPDITSMQEAQCCFGAIALQLVAAMTDTLYYGDAKCNRCAAVYTRQRAVAAGRESLCPACSRKKRSAASSTSRAKKKERDSGRETSPGSDQDNS